MVPRKPRLPMFRGPCFLRQRRAGRPSTARRAADHAARVPARAPAAHRHQGRLRRRRLRRLHGGARRESLGDARSRGSRSTPASGSCRRSPARRCSPSRACKAADGTLHPVQQAMVESPRLAMRLLHAGLRDEPVRPLQERAPSVARRRSRMRCPATCAAAPAIARSSPRRRRCTTCRRRDRLARARRRRRRRRA